MADLREIGLEGFYFIEKCYGSGQGGRRGRRGGQAVEAAAPRRQGGWRVDEMEGNQPSCINSRDAASIYGGVNVVNYTTTITSRRGKFYY